MRRGSRHRRCRWDGGTDARRRSRGALLDREPGWTSDRRARLPVDVHSVHRERLVGRKGGARVWRARRGAPGRGQVLAVGKVVGLVGRVEGRRDQRPGASVGECDQRDQRRRAQHAPAQRAALVRRRCVRAVAAQAASRSGRTTNSRTGYVHAPTKPGLNSAALEKIAPAEANSERSLPDGGRNQTATRVRSAYRRAGWRSAKRQADQPRRYPRAHRADARRRLRAHMRASRLVTGSARR